VATGGFEVQVDLRVEKDLKKVPRHIVNKFIDILDELEVDPIRSRSSADIKRLKGHPDLYRVRIGEYRVLYSVDIINKIVRVTTVAPRKNAYK
jgi:mRNA interferase RelE/StbE